MNPKIRSFGTLMILFIVFFAFIMPLAAQEETVVVPDLTGLNIPSAAAALNAVGLRLGTQTALTWDENAPFPPGTIVMQSVPVGEVIARDDTVNISFLSSVIFRLVYDDISFTMVNNSGVGISLTRLSFDSNVDGQQFDATRWRNVLNDGQCTQLWAVSRTQSAIVDGCTRNSTFWLTTNNPNEHFWTQNAGANDFVITFDGTPISTCPAAPPNSTGNPTQCEFALDTAGRSHPASDYLYFVYTQDRLAIINTTNDAWMWTDTTIYNFNPQSAVLGDNLLLGDPEHFTIVNPMAGIQRLAPGQCLLFLTDTTEQSTPPQNCDLIGTRTLSAGDVFWVASFERDSPFDPMERSVCPAATTSRLTICVIPR